MVGYLLFNKQGLGSKVCVEVKIACSQNMLENFLTHLQSVLQDTLGEAGKQPHGRDQHTSPSLLGLFCGLCSLIEAWRTGGI